MDGFYTHDLKPIRILTPQKHRKWIVAISLDCPLICIGNDASFKYQPHAQDSRVPRAPPSPRSPYYMPTNWAALIAKRHVEETLIIIREAKSPLIMSRLAFYPNHNESQKPHKGVRSIKCSPGFLWASFSRSISRDTANLAHLQVKVQGDKNLYNLEVTYEKKSWLDCYFIAVWKIMSYWYRLKGIMLIRKEWK